MNKKTVQTDYDSSNSEHKENRIRSTILKYFSSIFSIVLIIAFIVIFLEHLLCISTVSGNSMYPTYQNKERLYANRFEDKKYERNDVVIFYSDIVFLSKKFIKRIVAIPGDTVQIKDGYLYVNKQKINDNFPVIKDSGNAADEYTLQDNEYFVLGDNRNYSNDSRFFGPIKKSQIVGKAKRISDINKKQNK